MALYPAISGIRTAWVSNPTGVTGLHVNVLHFARRDGAAVVAADLVALRNGFTATLVPAYRGMFYTDFTLNEVLFTTLTPEPRLALNHTYGLAGTRVIDGDYLPEFNTSKVNWRTSYASKRYRGRSYFGGLREADNTNGSLAAGYQAAQATFVNALINNYGQAIVGSTYVFCILSDPDKILPVDPAPVGKDTAQLAGVESFLTNSTIFTMRSRLNEYRPNF